MEKRENMLQGLENIKFGVKEIKESDSISWILNLYGNAKVLQYRCGNQQDLRDIWYATQKLQDEIHLKMVNKLK